MAIHETMVGQCDVLHMDCVDEAWVNFHYLLLFCSLLGGDLGEVQPKAGGCTQYHCFAGSAAHVQSRNGMVIQA